MLTAVVALRLRFQFEQNGLAECRRLLREAIRFLSVSFLHRYRDRYLDAAEKAILEHERCNATVILPFEGKTLQMFILPD